MGLFGRSERYVQCMPDKAEIFARIARRYGGPAVRSSTLPADAIASYHALSLRADDLINTARETFPKLPAIYFDFVIQPEVNAFATREDGLYFIGVNTGIAFLLRLLTGRMLSDSSLFPWVGDASVERADLPKIDFYVPHADQMWASEELFTPRDPVRRLYIEHLADRALMFFVGHEITHILHGHVGYLQDKRGLRVYSELPELNYEQELALERQALELDADRRSAQTSVDSIRATQRDSAYSGMPWQGDIGDTAAMFREWAVVTALVYRMFGDQIVSDTNLSKSYPPLLSRWRYAEGIARFGIDQFWPADEREAASSAIDIGRREVLRAFATIIANSPLEAAPQDPPAEHLMMLQDHWNKVVLEKVRPYAYAFEVHP
jgi:hypothetical protein